MKAEDKKLAEEILTGKGFQIWLCAGKKHNVVNDQIIKPILEAMEQYHKDKLNEITDNDIMAWADKLRGNRWFGALIWGGLVRGARSFKDGEIKHIER